MFCDLKASKIIPIKVKAKKNNLALKIIPELNKLEARLGISGSLIEFNQIFDKKNAIDKPSMIKRLKIHKYEKAFLWFLSFKKLLLIRIAAAGIAGSQ